MKAYHVMDSPPLYTNCFLLLTEGGETVEAAVVDPAADISKFTRILDENNARLKYILLTHGHHDHVGSVEALRKKYGAQLCMNSLDAKHFKIKNDIDFTDGGKIVLGDIEFTTYFTPGHTPGSTCILCDNMLFAGDTLFAGDIGRTDLPGGNPEQMKESLKKLKGLIADDVRVLPGHEEFSTMGEEKRSNRYLKGL